MDAIEALKAANAEFDARLRQVGDEHLALPTPCSEWDVRALVNHVLVGSRMAVQLLDGMSREDVMAQFGDDLVSGGDPVADFNRMAAEVVDRFSAPGGLDGTVAHPAGDLPRTMFIGFRIGDASAHAWDLATAIGTDATLNDELANYLWETTQLRKDMLVASGAFGDGPSGTVADDASPQTRYLDLIGRRP